MIQTNLGPSQGIVECSCIWDTSVVDRETDHCLLQLALNNYLCLVFNFTMMTERTIVFSKPDFVAPWLSARCPHQCQPPLHSSACKTNALFPKIDIWCHCKIITNLWQYCKKITSVGSSWHGRTSSDASQEQLAGRGRRGRQGTRSTVPLSPGSGDYKRGCVCGWQLTVSDPPSPSSKFFKLFGPPWPPSKLQHWANQLSEFGSRTQDPSRATSQTWKAQGTYCKMINLKLTGPLLQRKKLTSPAAALLFCPVVKSSTKEAVERVETSSQWVVFLLQ